MLGYYIKNSDLNSFANEFFKTNWENVWNLIKKVDFNSKAFDITYILHQMKWIIVKSMVNLMDFIIIQI